MFVLGPLPSLGSKHIGIMGLLEQEKAWKFICICSLVLYAVSTGRFFLTE